jgi:hypothetical protein
MSGIKDSTKGLIEKANADYRMLSELNAERERLRGDGGEYDVTSKAFSAAWKAFMESGGSAAASKLLHEESTAYDRMQDRRRSIDERIDAARTARRAGLRAVRMALIVDLGIQLDSNPNSDCSDEF